MKLSAIVLLVSAFASIGAHALTVDQVAEEASDKATIMRVCRNENMFRNEKRIHRFDNFNECVVAMRDCKTKSHFCDNEELFAENGFFFRRFQNPFFCRQFLQDEFEEKNMSAETDQDIAQ